MFYHWYSVGGSAHQVVPGTVAGLRVKDEDDLVLPGGSYSPLGQSDTFSIVSRHRHRGREGKGKAGKEHIASSRRSLWAET